MGNSRNLDGSGGNSGGPPNPIKPPNPIGNKALTGGSAGLLTSTGGLFGGTGLLFAPFYNIRTNKSYILQYDTSSFNCEEDGQYDFPSPDSPNGVGRKVTIHKVILVYREIETAKFYVGVRAYISETDSFIFEEKLVKISPKKPPDNKLHTRKLSIIVTGERPQPYIRWIRNNGGFSVIKLTLCGNADEKDQV